MDHSTPGISLGRRSVGTLISFPNAKEPIRRYFFLYVFFLLELVKILYCPLFSAYKCSDNDIAYWKSTHLIYQSVRVEDASVSKIKDNMVLSFTDNHRKFYYYLFNLIFKDSVPYLFIIFVLIIPEKTPNIE